MRSARTVVLIATALVLGGCWTVPGAGPQRAGHNAFESQLTAGNAAGLRPDWTWQAEWTTPRAVQDPVVSPAGVHVSVGHKLVTVDPETGAERWRAVLYDAGAAAQLPIGASSPAYDHGQVLVSVAVYRNLAPGSGTRSYDATTGARLGDVARSLGEVPVPRDGRVVGTYAEVIGTGLGAAGYLVVDRDHPAQGWSAVLGIFGTSFPGISGPAVAADRFFFVSGSSLFAYPLAEPAGCAPPSPGAPFVLCPPQWSATFAGRLTPPALSGDESTLVVADAGHVTALDPASGVHLWEGDLPNADAPTARVAIDADHVFVTSGSTLSAFPRGGCPGFATCAPEWTADTGGTVAVQPAVAGGAVYTATTDGRLRAFRASGCGGATCPALWHHDLGAAVTGAPAVSGGRLFVGTGDGRLVSFRPSGEGLVRGPMSGTGSSTVDSVGGRPILRRSSSGTFGPTPIGSGTYALTVSDTGTARYVTLGLETGEGTLSASAGPFVSGVDADLTVNEGTGRFAGATGTLRVEDYATTGVTCAPTDPPNLFCEWNETATLTGSVVEP